VQEFDDASDFELALLLAPDLGSASFSRILTRFALTGARKQGFFDLSAEALQEEFGLSKSAASALSSGAKGVRAAVEGVKKRIATKPVRLITRQSAIYPKRVEEFCKKAPPGFLFAYGNLNALRPKTFCCLASRDAGAAVLEELERRVEAQVLESQVLVTGANTPAYQRAAVVPLRWGAPRVLVLDRGLFAALGDSLDQEPFKAARLWRYRFDPDTDLVLSQFRPDDAFVGVNNKMRDELVVALSDEVHVIHQSKGGNTDRLSSRAERLGRKVYR
jgi:predicted Rossmann fold nucleotide-binding protein DprA/Smf involved in DNA uptake